MLRRKRARGGRFAGKRRAFGGRQGAIFADAGRREQTAEGGQVVQDLHGQRSGHRVPALRALDHVRELRLQLEELPRLQMRHQSHREDVPVLTVR